MDARRPPSPFVLVHSPLVGPDTWGAVARELRRRGVDVTVAELRDVEGGGPFWQQHALSAARAIAALPSGWEPLLVGHSGAGPLLPAIRAAADRPTRGYLFVDAGLPLAGASRLAMMALESPDFAAGLRSALVAGERFPAWRDEHLRAIVPDATARTALLAGLRPRALPFFEEPIPVFSGWPDAPCGYVQFSTPYAVPAQQARAAGWPCRAIAAGHFHMLVDPEAVAKALLDLSGQWTMARGP